MSILIFGKSLINESIVVFPVSLFCANVIEKLIERVVKENFSFSWIYFLISYKKILMSLYII